MFGLTLSAIVATASLFTTIPQNSMGFYPTDPASGRFDFGSPQFKRVEIGLPSGKKFIITSDRKGDDDYIIKSIKLNGKVLHQHYITYKQIMDGGTLEYKMKKR